jgi:hypothetical protein
MKEFGGFGSEYQIFGSNLTKFLSKKTTLSPSFDAGSNPPKNNEISY